MRTIAGCGRRHSRAYPLTVRLAGKRAMMMLTAMPVGLSVALGLGSALSISRVQDEELIAEKRHRIEETLWAIHEANVQDLYETYESAKTNKDGQLEVDADGNMLTVTKE